MKSSLNDRSIEHKKTNIKPIIAIICCHKMVDEEHAQAVKALFIDAVYKFGAVPVLLPALFTQENELNELENQDAYKVRLQQQQAETKEYIRRVLPQFDGVLLTGSYSNVTPYWYDKHHEESYPDIQRDVLSFAAIAYARQQQMPVLAICRGHQELNVAYGGSLHPDYRKVGYTETHLYPADMPIENQYQPIHDIAIMPDTLLDKFQMNVATASDAKKIKKWQARKWKVNSLHNQCIDKLADGLEIMATAPDGLIEAIYDPTHPFMVGVQWHPEGCIDDELSRFLFGAFIEKARGFSVG